MYSAELLTGRTLCRSVTVSFREGSAAAAPGGSGLSTGNQLRLRDRKKRDKRTFKSLAHASCDYPNMAEDLYDLEAPLNLEEVFGMKQGSFLKKRKQKRRAKECGK